VHGLIFFYIQKFADLLATGTSTHAGLRSTVVDRTAHYLPSGVYPDDDAVGLFQAISAEMGRPLPKLLGQFGEFLAPHLVKVAGQLVLPAWRTLDLIENTEELIHSMVRASQPGAEPPVLEAVRIGPDELHLVYTSRRRLCQLATGLMRGMAKHFGETIEVEESSCMLRGAPFCSFTVRRTGSDTHASDSHLSETVSIPPDAVRGAAAATHAASPADDPMPDRIGDYTILGLIGSGAMGRVYLAHDVQLDRHVAVKVLNPVKARDPAARRRFIRESQTAASVEHPHVMTIHQVGEHAGLPYIVMQHLEGCTLSSHHRAAGHLPLPEVLRIGREIAEGLSAAHRRGLVHRDIKPDNIFLAGEDRSVRIIDFGLARDVGADAAKLTVEGAVVGTPAYMPPERISDHELDAKSDLFGLGVTLYELLADRLPFEGRSMVAMLAAVSRGDPKPLAEAAPGVPPAVCNLVMRLIAHNKAARPHDAHAVALELAALERQCAAG
jgi:tRNA A-37 threonylcarbamoyl transferase component Bud32